MTLCLDSVNVGVGNEEAVAIPQRNKDSLENVTNTVVAVFQVIGLYGCGMHQEQTDGVCTEHLHSLCWVGVVSQALGHLLSIRGQDQTTYDTVVKGGAVKEGCSQNCQ